MALSAYRTLLRSTRIAFTVDHRILVAARQKARTEFDQERSLAPGSEAAAEKIKYALEVAKVLREEVLQGEPVEGQKDRYRLRIHEHTVLGDNEDQRPENKKKNNQPPMKSNPLSGVKCSTL